MNLLIVDDEYYTVESISNKIRTLRPDFFEIFCAYNLTQALEAFSAHPIDLMICDIEMPGGSGLELLDQIRQAHYETVCIFLTAISPEYYEAATMDGASRFQKILYIDLPLIMPTIILMLILQVGNIMNVGYEKAYLMQNGTNTTVSEIISTYVYKVGLQTAQYSFATAVGLFNSVVNFIILVITNAVAKKTSDISIF